MGWQTPWAPSEDTEYLSEEQFREELIGQSIASVTEDTLTLSNGRRLQFDQDNSDCCSWIELKKLAACENLITSVEIDDSEDEDFQGYSAWINVIAEDGTITRIAEAEGNPGNGYYLHGWALPVRLI